MVSFISLIHSNDDNICCIGAIVVCSISFINFIQLMIIYVVRKHGCQLNCIHSFIQMMIDNICCTKAMVSFISLIHSNDDNICCKGAIMVCSISFIHFIQLMIIYVVRKHGCQLNFIHSFIQMMIDNICCTKAMVSSLSFI